MGRAGGGVLGDLVADEVYLYFMEIHLDQGSAKKLSGQETASLSPQTNSQLELDILHHVILCFFVNCYKY